MPKGGSTFPQPPDSSSQAPECTSPNTATERCPVQPAALMCSKLSVSTSCSGQRACSAASKKPASASCSLKHSIQPCASLAPLRPQIGIRTVFNILGPLTNPAGATRQVLGVADRPTAEKIAKALQLLGTDYALVVHAESGADEVDIEGHTLMYQVTPEILKRRRTRPADFGLPEGDREHLVADSVEHSAEIIRTVLSGAGGEHNAPPSPERSRYNVVAINAAVALLAAGKAESFNDAALMAKDSIDSGAAAVKLAALAKVSSGLG